MDEVSSTHWLMKYRVLTLVHQCRRLIRSEFEVRLALTDANLRERLEHYADESRTDELSELMTRIALELGEPESTSSTEPQPTAESPRRMYRGRPLGEAPADDEGATPQDDGAEDDGDRAKTVIYRGRVVR